MPIIDIHPHVISTNNVRYPLQPLGGNQSTWSRDRPTPYDKMIEEMDNAGVAKSAIVQASTAYGHDNSYVAEAIAAHPKRFTGVFSVDMLAPDNVEKMLDAEKLDGVYVCGSTGEGMLLPVAIRKKVVEVAVRNSPPNKHVVVHVGAWSFTEATELALHAGSSGAAASSGGRRAGRSLHRGRHRR